jgi:DNA-binding response OmpR family regulator
MRVCQPHILIVDDDVGLLMVLTSALHRQGYLVEAALSAEDALRSVERRLPALVLLDVHMPEMDGACFARELRDRGLAPHLIVMTGDDDAEQWAERLDADDYLPKPFALAELLKTVEPWAD